jgi:hypothetical protein
MKVFLLFLLAVFFMALRAPSKEAPRAIPLLISCVLVAGAMMTYRFA